MTESDVHLVQAKLTLSRVTELIIAGCGNGCQPSFFAAAPIRSVNSVPCSGGIG